MNKIKVIFAIIATLIGAGFASGQEINTFFYSFGLKGIIGLILCNIIFICIIYKVFYLILEGQVTNYKNLTIFLNKKHGFIINALVNIFMIITFFIMIAGFGAYFSQEVSLSTYIGSGIITSLCFITFMTKKNIVIKLSNFLVPILIFFIIIIGFINIYSLDCVSTIAKLPKVKGLSWIVNSVLYASYNSILLIPVLFTLKKYIVQKKDIIIISIICGLILFILALSIFFMLTKVTFNINKLEMPVIYVINHYYKSFNTVYAFIVLSSIYTTTISIGRSLLTNIPQNNSYYPLFVSILCITGFATSRFGFSRLVSILYPFFGYLGLVQLSLLFFSIQKDG